MEKRTILKIISIIMAVIAIFVIVCAATVTGGGFIDLSNMVKISLVGRNNELQLLEHYLQNLMFCSVMKRQVRWILKQQNQF